MLTFFRRGGVAQVVVGAIVVAIIIVFAVEFRPGRGAAARLAQECAVKVYDVCIDQKDHQAAYGLIIPYGMSAKAVKQVGLRRHVLDGLVERELLSAEAERLGIGISEQELDDELASGRFRVSLPVAQSTLSRQLLLCKVDPASDQCEPGSEMVRYVPDVKSVESGTFDYKKYERLVRNLANRGPREFKEMQERELVAARMRDIVRSRVRVSVSEAFMHFERERSKATVRTVLVKRDWFAKYVVDSSAAAAEKWALDNKQQVDSAWDDEKTKFSADCPLVSEIVQSFKPDTTDEEKATLRTKIDEAYERIKQGAAFENVARELSDGSTATSGGSLGCLNESYGAGALELLQALNQLKLNGISGVVETSRGFHIIKFHGKLEPQQVEKTGRHAIAKRLAVRFKADELAREFATKLIERVQAGAKLEQAARELSREYLTRGPATSAGAGTKKDVEPTALRDDLRPRLEISAPFTMLTSPIPGALPSEAPASKAFALEKPDAVHPAPIVTDDGFVVMQLKEKDLVKREHFDKDRAQIMRGMQELKATDALVRYVAGLRKAASDKIKVDARLMEEPDLKDQPGDS